ncbi:MAG: DUF6134 family protein [Bacteroidota bacterium]
MKRTLPICFFLLAHFGLYSQTLVYDAWKGSNKIGGMVVSQKPSPGGMTYSSEANMTVRFLISIDLKFTYEAVFVDGNLQSSETKNFRGGDLKDQSIGLREGEMYTTRLNGRNKKLHHPRIEETILTIYYHEPVNLRKVYSERWGDYLKIKPLGNHRYELYLANGDINVYTFKDGICTEIEINHSLGSVYFRLQEVKDASGRILQSFR